MAGLTVAMPAWAIHAGAQEQARATLPEEPLPVLRPAATALGATPASAGLAASLVGNAPQNAATGAPLLSFAPVPSLVSDSAAADNDPQDQAMAGNPPGSKIKQQQGRIFGVLPNFATVSGGTTPKKAGWKTDWGVANRQALDYSSFGYLFLSSGTAYAEDAHPSLNTYHGGDAIFWAYLWRGFLDKTDGVYQGTFLFPALLHEDTRYYASGEGPIWKRTLHAAGSIVIARSYSGRQIPNVAGIMGKVGTQAVSTVYYPPGSEGFGELAEKFTYACLRQAGINVFREFSPDLNDLVHHKRRAKVQ